MPYSKTVYPPILDLGEYRRELRQSRHNLENGEDGGWEESLLDIGEVLIEHCEFQKTKLKIKVGVHIAEGILPAR